MDPDVFGELKALVRQDQPTPVGAGEVCKHTIRHWCEAMEDGNPLYTNEEYARTGKYESIIAPPTMIWSWVMPPLWPSKEPPEVYKRIFEACAKGRFDQIIDTDVEMEFLRPLFPGDKVTAMTKARDVTAEKRTQLGNGHFITFESTYKNQKGELVCIQTVTLFIYSAREKHGV